MRASTWTCCLGLLATTVTLGAEVDSLSLSTELNYGHSMSLDTGMQSVAKLHPAIGVNFDDWTSIAASARVRLDAKDELEPGRPAFDTYASGSRPLQLGTAGTAELRDFYLEFTSERGLTRIGKQQIVWGRLDGIKVLDVVNPQDFREFILDDFAESRISLWSAYLDYSLGAWRTELAIVPDSTGHAIPESGAWFELTAPRFRYGSDPEQPTLPVVTDAPGHSLEETAAGIRLSRQIGSSEIAFVGYSGVAPEPLGRLIDIGGQPTVERFYERRNVYGVSVDMGLGAVVLRAEYALQPQRSFNVRLPGELATAELDQHRGAIGLDVDGPLGIFMNVQYLVDTVSTAPAGLTRPERDRLATLFVRKPFGYDNIVLEARWYHSLSDNDRLLSASCALALGENTSVEFAAQVFDGLPEGLFGQFSERDRLTINLRHAF